jgi:hypothetical protein
MKSPKFNASNGDKILPNLKSGDVIEWTHTDGYGTAVNGGQGIAADDGVSIIVKTASNLYITTLADIRPDYWKVVANIFKDKSFKLNVDKRMVIGWDDKPIVENGVVKFE